MGRRWQALGKHSGQIGILLTAVAVLITVVPFLAKTIFRPTIDIRVLRTESTVPPEIAVWARDAASFLDQYEPASRYSSVLDKYRRLIQAPEAAQLDQYRSPDDYGYLYVEVTNNSSESVSNVAIQVAELHGAWRVEYSGSSMSSHQAIRLNQTTSFEASNSVVLPLIPVVRPHEIVRLRIYGDPEFATVTASADGGSVKISNYYQDDGSFWFWWGRWNYKLPALMLIICLLFVFMSTVGVEVIFGTGPVKLNGSIKTDE